jgi:phosphoglycolate phosphatase-like HAD superfamily hydrolase
VATTYRGDVGSGNIIKQIFQEIYLGPALFSKTYGFSPVLHEKSGLNQQEKPIIEPAGIKKLSRENMLAVATGRPASEANYCLEAFGFKDYFERVLTLDDCLREEQHRRENGEKKPLLSKPNPFMLDTIVDQLIETPENRYYVGDMPDDMIAASRSRSGFVGIGLTASAQDKTRLAKNLKDNGATRVFDTARDLMQFFSAP